MDDLDPSPLLFSQHVETAEAEARRALVALHHHDLDRRIGASASPFRQLGRRSVTPEPISLTT